MFFSQSGITLPVYEYEHDIRVAALSLISQNQSLEHGWGLSQRVDVGESLKAVYKSLFEQFESPGEVGFSKSDRFARTWILRWSDFKLGNEASLSIEKKN